MTKKSLEVVTSFVGNSLSDSAKKKIKDRLFTDLNSSHITLKSCHSDFLSVIVTSDLNGLSFKGAIKCSCTKLIGSLDGVIDKMTIQYENF
jgi:hypothetical protein